jgi:hypothetical protein
VYRITLEGVDSVDFNELKTYIEYKTSQLSGFIVFHSAFYIGVTDLFVRFVPKIVTILLQVHSV